MTQTSSRSFIDERGTAITVEAHEEGGWIRIHAQRTESRPVTIQLDVEHWTTEDLRALGMAVYEACVLLSEDEYVISTDDD